ncbi:hypothetical protein CR513_49565, partial [Mucuna pruriens]
MGYFGEHKTYETVHEHFYWPHMKRDVYHICERCLICMMAKNEVSPHGLYTLFQCVKQEKLDKLGGGLESMRIDTQSVNAKVEALSRGKGKSHGVSMLEIKGNHSESPNSPSKCQLFLGLRQLGPGLGHRHWTRKESNWTQTRS